MPSALKTFLYCLKLLDDDKSAAVNKAYDIPIDKVLRRMALVECILSINIFFTLFHLGLSLQMHRIYGHTFDNY